MMRSTDNHPRQDAAQRIPLVLALGVAAAIAAAWGGSDRAAGQASSKYYDRHAIGGHYSIGLYGDQAGRSPEVKLSADQQDFEAFVGLAGDSLHQFSACTFQLQLPQGVELDGAIRWRPIPGLEEWGSATGEGLRVEFADSCQTQVGDVPVILGRVRLKATPKFRRGMIQVAAHQKYGCSVELCVPGYLKPYATGIPLDVRRQVSLLQRVRDIF